MGGFMGGFMHKLSFNNIFIPRKIDEIEEKERKRIETLLQQEVVKGDLDLSHNNWIRDLGNIKRVEGYLNLESSSIQDLGNLRYVKNWMNLEFTEIRSLKNLEYVGNWLNLKNTPIQDLGSLKSTGGSLNLSNISLRDLGNLKYVGGWLNLQDSQIEDLGKLKYVGWDLWLQNTPLSKQFSTAEELEQYIRNKVEVKGKIYVRINFQ